MIELITKEWKFEMKNDMNFSITGLNFLLISTFDSNDKSTVLYLGQLSLGCVKNIPSKYNLKLAKIFCCILVLIVICLTLKGYGFSGL